MEREVVNIGFINKNVAEQTDKFQSEEALAASFLSMGSLSKTQEGNRLHRLLSSNENDGRQ